MYSQFMVHGQKNIKLGIMCHYNYATNSGANSNIKCAILCIFILIHLTLLHRLSHGSDS